jgi:hypothetical protein
VALTPVKALKSGAALMMRTPTDDVTWVARYQAAMERLRTREATAKAGVSTQEVAGPGDATREPEPVEAVPGGGRLEVPGVGGSEPGSIAMTQVTVEAAKAETFVRDAGGRMSKSQERWWRPRRMRGKRRHSWSHNQHGRSRSRSRTS